jgi:hypothetical protein
MAGIDGVFHLAALWLPQSHEYPRAACDVHIRGTFNVIEATSASECDLGSHWQMALEERMRRLTAWRHEDQEAVAARRGVLSGVGYGG